MTYAPKTFTLPALEGLSKESVDAHIGLYQGYVKNFNAIETLLIDLMSDSEKNAHALSELVRRLPFEFDGMRLHEYYFAQWEGSAKALDHTHTSPLATALAAQFGSFEHWEKGFKSIAMMRGPGWAILYYDPEGKRFTWTFVGEQHQGHFATLPIILALDVWEHAFLPDYGTTGRGTYIDACFKNYNWSVIEDRFTKLVS